VAAADATVWSRRPTLLFFHGSLCWQTYDKVRRMGRPLTLSPTLTLILALTLTLTLTFTLTLALALALTLTLTLALALTLTLTPTPTPTLNKVRGMAALASKCKKAHGFLEKYSFGVRYEVRYLVITPA